MIIHSKKFVSDLDDDCLQPNAVDLRVSAISRINNNTPFFISDTQKVHRNSYDIAPVREEDISVWKLKPGQYQFETWHEVKVPEGYAGWLIPRSTLNRNGVFITSGLYDSGFHNFVGGVMHVSGETIIQVGTRIAQFIMFNAETLHLYDGDYNMEKNDGNSSTN